MSLFTDIDQLRSAIARRKVSIDNRIRGILFILYGVFVAWLNWTPKVPNIENKIDAVAGAIFGFTAVSLALLLIFRSNRRWLLFLALLMILSGLYFTAFSLVPIFSGDSLDNIIEALFAGNIGAAIYYLIGVRILRKYLKSVDDQFIPLTKDEKDSLKARKMSLISGNIREGDKLVSLKMKRFIATVFWDGEIIGDYILFYERTIFGIFHIAEKQATNIDMVHYSPVTRRYQGYITIDNDSRYFYADSVSFRFFHKWLTGVDPVKMPENH